MKKTKVKKVSLIIFIVAVFIMLGVGSFVSLAVDDGGSDYDYYSQPDDGEQVNDYKSSDWINSLQPDKQRDGVNCFDYYEFQSVQVNVNPDNSIYRDGDVVTFAGNLVNENDQPITNGEVFVRISRKNDEEGDRGDVVDEFFGLENISLRAKESRPVSFEWTIPSGIVTGEYQADYFFTVGKKFNLGGLSFSNEVVIGYSTFEIRSTNRDEYLKFDRQSTKVDGKKYNHIGNWPSIESGQSPTLTQEIVSTFEDARRISVMYELYNWDGLNDENKLDTKTETIEIPAQSRKEISYVFPAMNTSVYFLRITLTTDNQKSIINIRLTSLQEKPRLNYPAITEFPIRKGDEVTLYSCFHNTSGIDTEGKVEVLLTDEKGKRVAKIDYKGDIPSAMSADKTEFVAKKDYEKLRLKANVYDKNGELVDSYETTYDCKDFGSCKNKTNGDKIFQNGGIGEKWSKGWVAVILIFFVIIVISTAIVVFLNMRKKSGSNNQIK